MRVGIRTKDDYGEYCTADCALCGKGATAVWHGHGRDGFGTEVGVCCECASTVLPKLILDAVIPKLPLKNERSDAMKWALEMWNGSLKAEFLTALSSALSEELRRKSQEQ